MINILYIILQNFSIIIFLVISKPSIKKFIIPQTFTKNSPSSRKPPPITQRYFIIINVIQIFPPSTILHESTPSKLNQECNHANFTNLKATPRPFEIRQTCHVSSRETRKDKQSRKQHIYLVSL